MKLQTHLFVILSLSTLLACKSKSVIEPETTYEPPKVILDTVTEKDAELPTVQRTFISLGSLLNEYDIEAETIEMQGSASLVNANDNFNFNITIRMVRDSAIWIQLKKLGLEGARMLATKDSVFMIDRLHRTYFKKSWSQIQLDNKIPVDFLTMYRLLMGVPPYHPMDSAEMTKDDLGINIIYINEHNKTELAIAHPLKHITEFSIFQRNNDNRMNVKLYDYKLLYDNKNFSYLRDIEIHSNNVKQLYVNLSIVQVSRNKSFKIPFDILPGYQQMD